jgi:hypothetical protein
MINLKWSNSVFIFSDSKTRHYGSAQRSAALPDNISSLRESILNFICGVLFGSFHTFELVQLPVPMLIFFRSIVLAFADVAHREESTEIWTAIIYRVFIARSTWWINDRQSRFVELLACDTYLISFRYYSQWLYCGCRGK